MKILILIFFFQPELSIYKYYSKKLKTQEREILNKSFKFSISYLNSFYFNIDKKYAFFIINSDYYFFKNFHSIQGNILFQRKISDTLFNLKEILRIRNDTALSSSFIKINPLISFKNIYLNLNYELLLYLIKNKKIETYQTSFSYQELYWDKLKIGGGYIPNIPHNYIFFSPDFHNCLFITFYGYLFQKKIYPRVKMTILFKNSDINFEYQRKTYFYIAFKEFEDLLLAFPFNLEKSVFETSSLLLFSINYLFKNIKICFKYKKIFEDTITLYQVSHNNLQTKKGEFLERISFRLEMFNRFNFTYEKFNNYLNFVKFSFKLNYKKIILEPMITSIPSNKFLVFSSKIGYLYNRYYFFIEAIYPEPEIYPLKREVKIGIQKRF